MQFRIGNKLGMLWLMLLPYYLDAQNINVETVVVLPDEVRETSGLIFLNDRIITHNDDGDPVLYELDPDNGAVIRKLFINGASNVDWEDLCIDQQYMYIGDVGNSHGTRTDLRIYRVSLNDYFLSTNDTVSADTISITYKDQSNFNDDSQTNFDAAAIISLEDSLYVFTKNWGDFHTNVYSVPKTPGNYQVNRVARINSLGLIAGAVQNPLSKEIMMIGYNGAGPFIFRLYEFEDGNFAEGKMDRIEFSLSGSFQIEGIEAINETDYYITSETNVLGEATLYRVITDFVVGINDFSQPELQLYPNPVSRFLEISGLQHPGETTISLVDIMGKQIFRKSTFGNVINGTLELDLSGVPDGHYLMQLTTPSSQISRKLILGQTGF